MQPPYTAINPNSLVPMLEDGDFRLTESSAILKYLADKVGSPAYPKDLKQRAKVNEMMDWLNTNFYRDWGYGLCYPQIFPHQKRRSDEAQAATLEMRQGERQALAEDPQRPLDRAEQTTICAATRSPSPTISARRLVTLGEVIGVDFSPYPNVKRWLDNMKKLPSWAKVNEVFDGLRRFGEGAEVRRRSPRRFAARTGRIATMSFFPGKDPAAGDTLQCDAIKRVVVPRTVDLGDGFTVRRALPSAQSRMVGPFVFFDHFGPAEFQIRQRPRRAAASAYRACHRHLSVRRRDHAPRQPRHRGRRSGPARSTG